MKKDKNRVLVPLDIEEILRLMSALANKPNREEKDELLYERLEYYEQELTEAIKHKEWVTNGVPTDTYPF